MPWVGHSPPLPTLATQFEEYNLAHAGHVGKPVHAQVAWKHVTKSLAYNLPAGMHRADHARRRMLRAIK